MSHSEPRGDRHSLEHEVLASLRKRWITTCYSDQGRELYMPISNKMSDTDQRQRLLPFLGKYVQASGIIYDRKGTRAIAISEIVEVKDVYLTVEDQ